MSAWLKWSASVVLLGVALYVLDWRRLAESVAALTPWMLLAAVLLASAQFVPLLVRWHLLVKPPAESGWYACGARYLYANLLNAVSPANLGGDVYRFFAFRSAGRSDPALVAVLVRERLLGLASMLIGLLLGAVAMQLQGDRHAELARGVWLTLAGCAAAGLAILALLPALIARLSAAARRLREVSSAISSASLRDYAVLLGWSLFALGLWIACVQFVAIRLGLDLAWTFLAAVVTATELVRLLPVTVQGLGLREGAFAALFGVSGYSPESGFVLGAVAYLALSAALVLTGAVGAALLAFDARRGSDAAR